MGNAVVTNKGELSLKSSGSTGTISNENHYVLKNEGTAIKDGIRICKAADTTDTSSTLTISGGSFTGSPDLICSRAQIITFLFRLLAQ